MLSLQPILTGGRYRGRDAWKVVWAPKVTEGQERGQEEILCFHGCLKHACTQLWNIYHRMAAAELIAVQHLR